VEKMADGEIDVCLFNGGIRTSEQEYMAELLRKKSKVLVAFGSCAHEGCIPGLANVNNRRQIFDTVYRDTPSTENPDNIRPQSKTEMPEGELYLPGCPPEAERIWDAITAIVSGNLPPPGSVIGVDTTVCQECPRVRNEKRVKKFYRTWEIIPDETTCLLEQGLLCCGIATRAGCGAKCPKVGSPCIGCYGPNEGVHDYGGRMMTALASMIDSNDPEEIDRIIRDGIPDIVGSFYRFSLAGSLLRRSKLSKNGNGSPRAAKAEAQGIKE